MFLEMKLDRGLIPVSGVGIGWCAVSVWSSRSVGIWTGGSLVNAVFVGQCDVHQMHGVVRPVHVVEQKPENEKNA